MSIRLERVQEMILKLLETSGSAREVSMDDVPFHFENLCLVFALLIALRTKFDGESSLAAQLLNSLEFKSLQTTTGQVAVPNLGFSQQEVIKSLSQLKPSQELQREFLEPSRLSYLLRALLALTQIDLLYGLEDHLPLNQNQKIKQHLALGSSVGVIEIALHLTSEGLSLPPHIMFVDNNGASAQAAAKLANALSDLDSQVIAQSIHYTALNVLSPTFALESAHQ